MKQVTTKNKVIVTTRPFYNSEIPSDWSIPVFGDVFTFLKTFSFSREQLTSVPTKDKIKNIHYGDIHATYGNAILDLDLEKTIPYLIDGIIDPKDFEDESFPALQEGDLIIADASEDYKGVCVCIELKNVKDTRIVSGLHTLAAKAPEEKIAIGYRAYVLKHEQVIRELRRIATGTSVYSVSKSNLSNVRITLPPLTEQRVIAQILSNADSIIHKNERILAQKELQKKWLMQNLLTGKLRLEGYNGLWKSVSIGKLFNIIDRYIDWDDNSLYNLISIRRRNGGVFFRDPLFGYQIGVKKLKEIHQNDFVISKRQVSHGAWAVIDETYHKTLVSDEYDCLEFANPDLLIPQFWKWYCQLPILTHFANVDSDGVHIEKSIFDYQLFKKRKVKIPSSTIEQRAISKVLQTADKEINILHRKVEKLREQKKGLMQQLLTGKIRLK